MAFVTFAIAGGLLALRWRWVVWLHLPAAAWAAMIEFAGWVCPLTPLENHFRALAGESTYDRGFVAHYRSEEHTSELQSLMRISYAVFCLKKKTYAKNNKHKHTK